MLGREYSFAERSKAIAGGSLATLAESLYEDLDRMLTDD